MFKFAREDSTVKVPVRKHEDDAGVDVFANENVVILPFSMKRVHTGLYIEIPRGQAVFAWPKGGSPYLLGAGVFDAGYQGEVMIKIANYSPIPMVIRKGTPIAQLVKTVVSTEQLQEVPKKELHPTKSARGSTGGINR